jgi:PAS domain S-box-containing protein
MSAPLATALTLLAGITLYAAIHSLLNVYYRPQRRIHLFYALMCLFAFVFILLRLQIQHSATSEEFIYTQRLGFLAAQLIFLCQVGFISEYSHWRPRRLIAALVSSLLVLLLVNLFLPYGLANSRLPTVQQIKLLWGETITDTRIYDKTPWWYLQWFSIFAVFGFQFAAAFRLRKRGDIQRGNALLWFGGIFFAAVLSNLIINLYLFDFTQIAEFGFIAMIVLMSLHLNREARITHLRVKTVEDMWSSLVMNAPNFILLVDPNGKIEFINHDLPGSNRDLVLGSSVYDYLYPDSRAIMQNCLHKLMIEHARVNTQVKLSKPKEVWLDIHMAPLANDEKVERAIVIATNINSQIEMQNKLQLSESRHRQLLNTIPYGVQEIDTQGNITYSNAAHDRLFGYEPGQMLGMSIYDLPANNAEVNKLREYIKHINTTYPNPETYIKQSRRKNGEVFDIKVDWDYLRDDQGNVTGFISVLADITQQLVAEKALRESEKKFRQLAENISKVFFIRDMASNRMLYVSPAYTTIWGRPLQEIYDDPADFIKSIHPDDKTHVLQLLSEQNREGRLFDAEYRIIDTQDAIHWIHARTYPIEDDSGNITRLAGIVEDITKSKEDERALIEYTSRLQQIVESSEDMFWISELSPFRLLFVSPACEKICGITPEQLYQNPQLWLEYIHEDDKPAQKTRIEQLMAGRILEFQDEYRIINARGELRYIQSRGNPISDANGKVSRIGIVAKDITAFKLAELHLQESTRELKKAHDFTSAVVDTVGAVIVVLDRDGKIVRFNNACEYISGYTAEEVIGRFAWDFLIPPEERASVKSVFAGLSAGDFPNHYENYWLHKKGDKRLIAWSNTCLTDSEENVEYVVATGVDITEQRRAEAALRDSSEKYRTLMEYASDVILIADLQGRLIEGNSRALALLEYDRTELIGRSVKDIHPPAQLQRILPSFQELVHTGHTVVLDTQLLSRTGKEIPVDINANLIEYQGRKVAVGFMRDIRVRKQIEEEQRQAERRHRAMLVREVHHRIKNNLQGVIGLLRNSLADDDSINPASELLVTRAINQITTIAMVHGLQAHYTSGQVLVCEVTRAIVDQARSYAPSDVHIEFNEIVSQPAVIQEEEAIPLALVINEILTNAIKHIPATVTNKQVIIEIKGGPEQGMDLLIFNAGARLPKDLKSDVRNMSGVGLDLIHALLPKQHARFSLSDDPLGTGVYAKLRLEPAILSAIMEPRATHLDQHTH